MENTGLISPNLVTFLLTMVNIGILFLLLRKLLFKRVTKFMEERAQKIQNTIAQAEKDKTQAKKLLEQYEEQLKHAETEADHIIKVAKAAAEQETQRIIGEGKSEAQSFMTSARKQIEGEKNAAFAKFRDEAVMLVLAASSKLIGREITKDDSRHFMNMLREELTAQITVQYSAQKRAIERQIEAHKGVLEVTLESAAPVDAAVEDELKAALCRQTGAGEIKLRVDLAAQLLAGYRLRIGGLCIDASLRSQLEKMTMDLTKDETVNLNGKL